MHHWVNCIEILFLSSLWWSICLLALFCLSHQWLRNKQKSPKPFPSQESLKIYRFSPFKFVSLSIWEVKFKLVLFWCMIFLVYFRNRAVLLCLLLSITQCFLMLDSYSHHFHHLLLVFFFFFLSMYIATQAISSMYFLPVEHYIKHFLKY